MDWETRAEVEVEVVVEPRHLRKSTNSTLGGSSAFQRGCQQGAKVYLDVREYLTTILCS